MIVFRTISNIIVQKIYTNLYRYILSWSYIHWWFGYMSIVNCTFIDDIHSKFDWILAFDILITNGYVADILKLIKQN